MIFICLVTDNTPFNHNLIFNHMSIWNESHLMNNYEKSEFDFNLNIRIAEGSEGSHHCN
jgi:hypothetical protein